MSSPSWHAVLTRDQAMVSGLEPGRHVPPAP
jgi:hypothetical protein